MKKNNLKIRIKMNMIKKLKQSIKDLYHLFACFFVWRKTFDGL